MKQDPIIRRLNKIEGQVRGVAGMIRDERYCVDILHQLRAVRSALAKVEDNILRDHAASCVESAIQSGDADDQREKFSELIELFSKIKG